MARIRTIKPEFPQSESIGRLSREARLLFVQLWTVVDDDGRARAASRLLASLLYPYDDDAPALIDGWLAELEDGEHIIRYEHEGSVYLAVSNWRKHQKIDHPSKSKLPNPRESSRILAKFPESRAHAGPRTMDQDLGPRTTSVASPPADEPPKVDAPAEQPDSPEAALHAHRSQAAGIVRRVYWQGNDPPPAAIVQGKPGWSMGRELSIWDSFVGDGEYEPAEINAGLEVAREVLEFDDDQPLSLRLFNVKGRRDRLRLCIQHAQLNQPVPEDNGHIGDILREAVNGGDNGGGPVERGGGGVRHRRNADRRGRSGQRARASPGR